MRLSLLYFEGCPHWTQADDLLHEVAGQLDDVDVDRRIVDTPEAAERERFRGSPTVLIEGTDPFADSDSPVGLSCRIYATPDGPSGTPTKQQLLDAISDWRRRHQTWHAECAPPALRSHRHPRLPAVTTVWHDHDSRGGGTVDAKRCHHRTHRRGS